MGGGADGTLTAPVVFVGYGISEPSVGFDELKGLNLKGKIVLLLSDAPGPGQSPVAPPEDQGAQGQVLPGGAARAIEWP